MYLQEIVISVLILIIVVIFRSLINAKKQVGALMLAKQAERRDYLAQEERERQREEIHLVLKTTKRDRTRLHLVDKCQSTLMYSPAGYTKPDDAIALGNRIKNAKLVVMLT